MWDRVLAIWVARNREFYRDRAGLIWNLAMPVMMIVAFMFIFGSGPKDLYKVGVLGLDAGALAAIDSTAVPDDGIVHFLATRHIRFIPLDDQAAAISRIARHQLDLLLAPEESLYWVNPEAPNGYIVERLLLGTMAEAATADAANDGATTLTRRTAAGEALSYADWVLPGVLAMNLMFSSLWGVGWVVVRYRKNGVLRRLKATPLAPFEFLTAQVLSRLTVVMGASMLVFVGASLILDFPMRGSYVALLLVFIAGALAMISLGLTVASRLRTEELADGLLNLMSWPMLLLSGVWFSMDGTSAAAQTLSQLMPLTHLVDAARRIMIDGAGVVEVLPQIGLLLAIAALLLVLAARLFRWE